MASKLSRFFAELKRRKVYRVAVVYVVVGLGILGAAEVTLDPLGLEALRPYIVILVLLGFPIALVLAWAYEVKPEEPRVAEKAPEPTAEAEQRKSIVVLPFDNMSPDPNDAYFADGLTEEIITHLSCCGLLRVISRNSAMVLKDTRKDTRTIAKELDVQCVLEGSVRKEGDDLRITAQLIDAGTDTHLWAETYEGTLQAVFDIQETVARSIVKALQLQLGPEEERRLTERPIDDVRAYDCYLRARHETELFTKDGFDRAIEHLRAGLDIIGENAALYAGIGYVYFHYANIGLGQEDYADQAEEYAQKALDLNPESAEAHLVLGLVFQAFRGNPREAFHHLNCGLTTKPDDPHLLYWLVIAQYAVGKSEASEPLVRRLQQVDPLSPYTRWLPAGVDLGLGRFDRAVDFAWHQVPQLPHFDFFHAVALTYAGRFDQALTLIRERTRGESDDLFWQMMRILGLAIERKTEPLNQLLSGERSKTMRRDPVWAYFAASFCALAGLEETAMELLTVAVDQGFLNYPLLNEFDPFLAELRGQPQFDALLERVKHEWENFEV